MSDEAFDEVDYGIYYTDDQVIERLLRGRYSDEASQCLSDTAFDRWRVDLLGDDFVPRDFK